MTNQLPLDLHAGEFAWIHDDIKAHGLSCIPLTRICCTTQTPTKGDLTA